MATGPHLPPYALKARLAAEDHLAACILDLVNELDLAAIEDVIQEENPRGEKPYSPRMLVTLLLYG